MKHYFKLMNLQKAFKEAVNYHAHAIVHGNDETKKKHIEHHIKGGTVDVLLQRSSKPNNK